MGHLSFVGRVQRNSEILLVKELVAYLYIFEKWRLGGGDELMICSIHWPVI
jgi:hypothetical protein